MDLTIRYYEELIIKISPKFPRNMRSFFLGSYTKIDYVGEYKKERRLDLELNYAKGLQIRGLYSLEALIDLHTCFLRTLKPAFLYRKNHLLKNR